MKVLGLKIIAVLSAVIGTLLVALKLKSDKINKLEREKVISDKKEEILTGQGQAVQEVLENESIEIKKRIASNSQQSNRDELNSM